VTTLREHIESLDTHTWAALTKRTAERAVAAAQQLGKEPPAQLAAVAAMSEAQLVEHRQKSTWTAKRRPTARMKLIEAEHQHALAQRRAHEAERNKDDALADAAAARVEAQASAAAAEAARERARATLDELASKELQRRGERRESQAQLESLAVELDQIRADATAARAAAVESAAVASAAREREAAALNELARKGARDVTELRKAKAALEKSQGAVEKLRSELEEVRADAVAKIAAAVEQASAAQQRAGQRMAERAADRREAQAGLERLREENEKIRADAEAEVAAAREQVRAAEDRANQRMTERAADRVSAREALEQLQTHLDQARTNAAVQVDAAREQAALAIAAAQEGMDEAIARVRAETQQQVDEAVQARARAEADVDRIRAQAQTAQAPAARGLTIPIPGWEVRPATRHIENALTALHQINYILEVGMAEEVEAQIPLDVELVVTLARTVQRQAEDLGQEFVELPARFSVDSQVAASASYAAAAAEACQAFLRRIGSAAQQLRHRDASPDAEVIAAVMSMLADPHVQELVPEPAED
jgi:hypothetical protein